MTLLFVLLVAFGALAGAWMILRFMRQRAATVTEIGLRDADIERNDNVAEENSDRTTIPFSTEAILDAQNSIYKLAFGVARVDYEVLGHHRRVLSSIQDAAAGAATQSRYFPRKPALLPKLLRAINTVSSGRNEIVRLILQDAVLAGNVLKRANSVYYSGCKEVIESIDRAVTILGNEGLRAPVASAVMQPVFQLPAGFFEHFAPTTWEEARRTAVAAEEFARVHRSADAFVAHLAGMLNSLGRIVLFRLALDKYREQGNVMPKAEVFVRVMIDRSQHVARAIAAAWEMSPPFLEALDAQIAQMSPERMTPLARTLYYANLCGTLATLHAHGLATEEQAKELLLAQGLKAENYATVWKAANDKEIVN